MADDRVTTGTRLALIEQSQRGMDGKLDELLALAKQTNGRVTKVEQQEIVCQASGVTNLPKRVRDLEDAVAEMKTVAKIAKWAVGGGLLGALSLAAQLLDKVR